jgi:TetR/AcrR family transcriptional regulator, transcriptional repressor for nem operon
VGQLRLFGDIQMQPENPWLNDYAMANAAAPRILIFPVSISLPSAYCLCVVYNTFESKKHLYLECLKHYNNTVLRRRLTALLSGASAKEGIRAFFSAVLDELDDPKTPRICLFGASLSNDVLAERELKRYVVDGMTAFSAVFLERLKSAKGKAELPANIDPEAATQVLITYLQGLYLVIRVLQDRAQVERQIDTLLGGLGL